MTKRKKIRIKRVDLAYLVSKKTGYDFLVCNEIIEEALATTKKQVTKGRIVTLLRFGTFRKSRLKKTTIVNPSTGEIMKRPAQPTIKFIASETFKREVKKREVKKREVKLVDEGEDLPPHFELTSIFC